MHIFCIPKACLAAAMHVPVHVHAELQPVSLCEVVCLRMYRYGCLTHLAT